MFNAGIVVTRETIYDRIWGFDFETSSKSLDVYIGYLRRKTEADGERRIIHTVRGVGYTARSRMSLRLRLALVVGDHVRDRGHRVRARRGRQRRATSCTPRSTASSSNDRRRAGRRRHPPVAAHRRVRRRQGPANPARYEPDAVVQVLDHQRHGPVPGSGPAAGHAHTTRRSRPRGPGKPQQVRSVSVDGTPYRVLTTHVTTPTAARRPRSRETSPRPTTCSASLDIRLLLIALAGTAVRGRTGVVHRPPDRAAGRAAHRGDRNVAVTQDLENTIPVDRQRRARAARGELQHHARRAARRHAISRSGSSMRREPRTAHALDRVAHERGSSPALGRAGRRGARGAARIGATSSCASSRSWSIELVDLATDARSEEPPQTVDLGELASAVVDAFSRRSDSRDRA